MTKDFPPSTKQEVEMIASLLDGSVKPKELCGSTSKCITAFLAVGRYEELPDPYTDKREAWDRLNAAQREVVKRFNPTFNTKAWDTPVYYG